MRGLYGAEARGGSEKDASQDTWHGVAAFLRGDHQVNETKLLGAIGAAELRTMQAEELEQYFNGPAGYLGPVGLKPDDKPLGDGLTVVVDKSLEGRKNMVCGANKLDYHLRNVTPGRDFTWTLMADIRSVNEGEACPERRLCAASWSSARRSRSATSSSWATSTPSRWARACWTRTARK